MLSEAKHLADEIPRFAQDDAGLRPYHLTAIRVGWGGRGGWRGGVDHAQFCLRPAECDPIAVAQRRALMDPLLVDESAVLAVEILDRDLRSPDLNSRMLAGGVGGAEDLSADDVFAFGKCDDRVADFQLRPE